MSSVAIKMSIFAYFSFTLLSSGCDGILKDIPPHKSWSAPVLLSAGSKISDLQVSYNKFGQIYLIWQQFVNTEYRIWVNNYDPVKGWGPAGPVDYNPREAFYPQIAVNDFGYAIAVWGQHADAGNEIWASRYIPGTSWWSNVSMIESEVGYETPHPDVAIDDAGNAIAVWTQNQNDNFIVMAKRYEPQTGWGEAVNIGLNTGYSTGPKVGIDDGGNATVVWTQSDGVMRSIWANRYVMGAGWGTAVPLDQNSIRADIPEIAIDHLGNAIVVWEQMDGLWISIWASHFSPISGWDKAFLLENNTGNALYPQLAVSNSGNAIAVWEQYDGTFLSIWASRFVPGIGWKTAVPIESSEGDAEYPQVRYDNSGNAIVVWQQEYGTQKNICSNFYSVEEYWETEQILGEGIWGDMGNACVAIDDSGNAVSIWTQQKSHQAAMWFSVLSF